MQYTVSLAVMSWETATIFADSEEEALSIAREQYYDGEWDGVVNCTERVEEDDTVCSEDQRYGR